MRFEFYRIEHAQQGGVNFRVLDAVSLDALPGDAVAAVNAKFSELVASNPEIGSMIVVCRSLGDRPGIVVAAERVHALTSTTLERRGQPARELTWVVDDSVWQG